MDDNQLLVAAVAELHADHLEQAFELCKTFVQRHPQRPDGWCLLGMVQRRQGRLTEAALDYRQSLRLDPRFADSENNLNSLFNHILREMLPYFHTLAICLQTRIELWSKNQVQGGIFQGMRLLHQDSTGLLRSMLMGIYELELHPWMEEAFAADYSRVINIGCGEGYYAVGMARRMPHVQVYAFDVNPTSQKICRETAEVNGVGERVVVDGLCTPQRLHELLTEQRTLLLVDCEGCEMALLDPEAAPALARTDVIVECHDFVDLAITATLRERFAPTHRIEQQQEMGRDPNLFSCLHDLPSELRWMAVCESRPMTMHWLRMTAHAAR